MTLMCHIEQTRTPNKKVSPTMKKVILSVFLAAIAASAIAATVPAEKKVPPHLQCTPHEVIENGCTN